MPTVFLRWYGQYGKLIDPEQEVLSDCDYLWCSSRKQSTIGFTKKLNEIGPFLNKNESVDSYIKQFKLKSFIRSLQQKFRNNSLWWEDGHKFSEAKCIGLPYDIMPYLKFLRIRLLNKKEDFIDPFQMEPGVLLTKEARRQELSINRPSNDESQDEDEVDEES